MKLNEKILYHRKRMGLSQEALAERLGVSRQAVSKWELGSSVPELETLVAMAKLFGVSTDELLMEDTACAENKTQAPAMSSRLDQLPGFLGKMFRKYGWLAGIYLSACGLLFTAIGYLARLMTQRMFQPIAGMEIFHSFYRSNPVTLMGGFLMVIGLVMVLGGILLAIVLRHKGKK